MAADDPIEELARIARAHGLSPEAQADIASVFVGLAATEMSFRTLSDTTPGVSLASADATFPPDATDDEIASFHTMDRLLRYEDLGPLGAGGLAEVRRAMDRDLNRVVAMKILRSDLQHRPHLLARFLEEAQVTAQLEHPSIVPVHDVGRTPDGRMFFTMKEIRGQTLRQWGQKLHAEWNTDAGPHHYRGVGQVMRKVAEALAFAHHRGVIHRDLKPTNIMVGEFGVVHVVDWGLAAVLAEARSLWPDGPDAGGGIAGTPYYLAPEQAEPGEPLSTRTDVYGLGATLYELLGGSPPYAELSRKQALSAVLRGPPAPPTRSSATQPRLPDELVDLTMRCLATAPDDRPDDGLAVAEALSDWLDGARRAERGATLVAAAQHHQQAQRDAEQRAGELESRAAKALKSLAPTAPIEDKRPHWELQDRAQQLRIDAAIARAEHMRALGAALAEAPDLPAAHLELASTYRTAHEQAERSGDAVAAAEAEVFLRDHDIHGVHAAYLAGDGTLSLSADMPRARATLFRMEATDRQLEPVLTRRLGKLPLFREPIGAGSWLVLVESPGRPSVRLPIFIERGEDWAAIHPGTGLPEPLALPSAVPSGTAYVPAGWAVFGGDPEVPCGPRQRLWVPGFFMEIHPVSNAEYIAFLDDLVDRGLEEQALRHVPRERSGSAGELGAALFARNSAGHFYLTPDAEGDEWFPDAPVLMIDAFSAQAYADYRARTTGLPWRLPTEWEWEKAARGVDARAWPMGNHADPTWMCIRSSHEGPAVPARRTDYPRDLSPYGVRGLAGGVRDWCCSPGTETVSTLDGTAAPTPERVEGPTARCYRGGDWFGLAVHARAAYRAWNKPEARNYSLGFRLVCSLQ